MPDYLSSGRGGGHMTISTFWDPGHISGADEDRDISNLVCRLNVRVLALHMLKEHMYGVHSRPRDLNILGNTC